MTEARPHVFRDAITILRDGGLTKGNFKSTVDNSHCTVGALCSATDGRFNYASSVTPEIALLVDLLRPQLDPCPSPACRIYRWNDKPERTVEEVIAVLELAAELAEGYQRVDAVVEQLLQDTELQEVP